MIIIISSIAQINSWSLAQNMCGSCIHRNMCDFVLTYLGDLFSPLSNNNHPTKKTEQKTQILNKKFLGNEICLLFLFCCFVLHIIWCMLLLMCFDLHASSLFLTPLFSLRDKTKSLVCICKQLQTYHLDH
jgi:hypothetical protein